MIAPRDAHSRTNTLGVNFAAHEAAAIRAWANAHGESISEITRRFLRDRKFATELLAWHARISQTN